MVVPDTKILRFEKELKRQNRKMDSWAVLWLFNGYRLTEFRSRAQLYGHWVHHMDQSHEGKELRNMESVYPTYAYLVGFMRHWKTFCCSTAASEDKVLRDME
ncbi:hypothetical protein NPIL_543311 [Nephila pilipes]|uniref:Uncharacterized protein n=1 Tax=Nephila pilipes TaxID=299642 RepID=A0A8X6PXM0_NEPPI|nr:hypothetical protein NPIL_543311 [Nephila pilipes]